jgi:hypothetical protein
MRQHKVNRNSLHARIYLWWYEHKYKDNYAKKDKPGTNLCPYMRAILFWAPFRFIFWNWVKVYEWSYDMYISLNMLTIPFLMTFIPLLAGFGSYKLKKGLWIVDLVILGVAALIGVVCLLVLLIGIMIEEYKSWKSKQPEKPKKIKVKTTSRFVKLLKDFGRSAHDGVCPEITFTNTDGEVEVTVHPSDPAYSEVEDGDTFYYE